LSAEDDSSDEEENDHEGNEDTKNNGPITTIIVFRGRVVCCFLDIDMLWNIALQGLFGRIIESHSEIEGVFVFT